MMEESDDADCTIIAVVTVEKIISEIKDYNKDTVRQSTTETGKKIDNGTTIHKEPEIIRNYEIEDEPILDISNETDEHLTPEELAFSNIFNSNLADYSASDLSFPYILQNNFDVCSNVSDERPLNASQPQGTFINNNLTLQSAKNVNFGEFHIFSEILNLIMSNFDDIKQNRKQIDDVLENIQPTLRSLFTRNKNRIQNQCNKSKHKEISYKKEYLKRGEINMTGDSYCKPVLDLRDIVNRNKQIRYNNEASTGDLTADEEESNETLNSLYNKRNSQDSGYCGNTFPSAYEIPSTNESSELGKFTLTDAENYLNNLFPGVHDYPSVIHSFIPAKKRTNNDLRDFLNRKKFNSSEQQTKETSHCSSPKLSEMYWESSSKTDTDAYNIIGESLITSPNVFKKLKSNTRKSLNIPESGTQALDFLSNDENLICDVENSPDMNFQKSTSNFDYIPNLKSVIVKSPKLYDDNIEEKAIPSCSKQHFPILNSPKQISVSEIQAPSKPSYILGNSIYSLNSNKKGHLINPDCIQLPLAEDRNISDKSSDDDSSVDEVNMSNASTDSLLISAAVTESKKLRNVSLVPKSLKENIGCNIISSSQVYLIIIEWSVAWFSQYEVIAKPLQHLPPILPDTVPITSAKKSYRNENEYYNTYFKLLLLECWHKMYLSWKETRKLRYRQVAKIQEFETKRKFNKYVLKYFATASEVEQKPNECCIVMLKFNSLESGTISMLGYVARVTSKKPSTHDNEHNSLKSSIVEYKVTIYTVFKCADINLNETVYITKLFNIRHYLQQNDALCYISKSYLCEAILSPNRCEYKLSLTILNEKNKMAYAIEQISERILDLNPLFGLINTSFLSFIERMEVISDLIKRVRSVRSDSKVIICSKYVDSLTKIANELKKQHVVVLISLNKIPSLQKYSLNTLSKQLLDDDDLSEEEENSFGYDKTKAAERKVLKSCDVILMLLFDSKEFIVNEIKSLDINCCILDESHDCTETESIIPLSIGFKKFIMTGNENLLADVSPVTAAFGYDHSLFNRGFV